MDACCRRVRSADDLVGGCLAGPRGECRGACRGVCVDARPGARGGDRVPRAAVRGTRAGRAACAGRRRPVRRAAGRRRVELTICAAGEPADPGGHRLRQPDHGHPAGIDGRGADRGVGGADRRARRGSHPDDGASSGSAGRPARRANPVRLPARVAPGEPCRHADVGPEFDVRADGLLDAGHLCARGQPRVLQLAAAGRLGWLGADPRCAHLRHRRGRGDRRARR